MSNIEGIPFGIPLFLPGYTRNKDCVSASTLFVDL
jgi:hypothetical protein